MSEPLPLHISLSILFVLASLCLLGVRWRLSGFNPWARRILAAALGAILLQIIIYINDGYLDPLVLVALTTTGVIALTFVTVIDWLLSRLHK